MIRVEEILDNRDVTTLYLSIGTGLCIEPLFKEVKRYDPAKVLVPVNPDDYGIHYFNVWTLVRNIITATGQAKDLVKTPRLSNYIVEIVLEELHVLASLYESISLTPTLLIPNYDRTYREYVSKVLLKEKYAIRNEIDMVAYDVGIKVLNMDLPIAVSRTTTRRSLLTSHNALDMFNGSDVLESNTGRLVKETNLVKKYKKVGKEDLSFLPWDKDLLHFLGDGNFLQGESFIVKRKFLELARSYNVTRLTSNHTLRELIKKAKV